MKNFLILCVLVPIVTCSKNEILLSKNIEFGKIYFQMEIPPYSMFSLISDSAVISITAEDILEIREQIEITDTAVQGTINDIPAGKNRKLTIDVYDRNKIKQYTGSTEADVIADTTIDVKIHISRISGNVYAQGILNEPDKYNLPEADLMIHYPFAGNFKEMSYNTFNDTNYGANLTTDRFGTANRACIFDGNDDRIEIAHSSLLNIFPITISFWMKTSQTFTTNTTAMLINKYYVNSSNGYAVGMDREGKIGAFYYKDSVNYVSMNYTTGSYNDNQWHNVIFMIDSTGGYLLVDGEQKDYHPWVGNWGNPNTKENLHIAYYPPGGGNPYYMGSIDDIRIYKRKLNNLETLILANEK